MENRYFLKKLKTLRAVICIAAALLSGILSAALLSAPPVFADYEYNGRNYYIQRDYEISHGVVYTPDSAVSGEYVTVTAEPDAGYITSSLTVLMDDENHIYQFEEEVPEISHPDPDTIIFRMPNANVMINVEFSTDDRQRVFICDMEGGTVEPDINLAAYGDKVMLTIKPDNGWDYVPDSLKLYEVDPWMKDEHEVPDSNIEMIEENSRYAYTMRSPGAVYVRAEFTEHTEETKYQVSVDGSLENGSLTVDEEWASAGWTVTVTAEPDTRRGYALKTLSVTDSDDQPVAVTDAGSGKYTFTMPEGDVFVTAVFDIPVYGITVISEDVDVPEGRSTNCRIDAPAEETTGIPALLTLNMPVGTELALLTAVGDDTGTEIPCTLRDHRDESYVYYYEFMMPGEPVTVTAHFTFTGYTIDIAEDFEGTVEISAAGAGRQPLPYKAAVDETVNLVYNAPENYDLDVFKYRYLREDGREMTVNAGFSDEGTNVYVIDFTMPGADVTLIAELVPEMSEWHKLQEAIDAGPQKQTITLYGDLRAVPGDKAITISQGQEITLDLNGFTLDRNLALPEADGHAVIVKGGGTLTIQSSDGNKGAMGRISGGNVTENGGGILCQGRVNLYAGSIYDNRAGSGGGGVFVDKGANFWMYGGEIENNRAGNGAGVHVTGSHFYGRGGTIKNNFASSIGGGVCMDYGVVSIDSMEISGNTAENGGGIGRIAHYDLSVINSSIKNNTASNGGGGLYVDDGGESVSFSDTDFSGNKAKEGAGVLLGSGAEASFTNVTFEANAADENGGGIYCNGTLRPADCTFTGNRGEKAGGAVYQRADASFEARNCVFEGNAGGTGGALHLESGDKTNAILQSCTVSGNTAGTGGGIYTAGKGRLVMDNVEMTGNHADIRGGGLFTAKGGLNLILTGVNIRDNNAVREGGGIMAEGTTIGMKGVVTIWDNSTEESAPYWNLCFGAGSFIANPGLIEGSKINISALSKMVFAKKISRYQLRYFTADSGRLDFAADASARISTPIFASIFSSGSWILTAVLFGAAGAAAAAVILIRKKKRKKKETETETKEETETETNDEAEEEMKEGTKDDEKET